MKAQNLPAAAPESRLVLHYTGADDDRGGVISVIHGLAGAGRFECVLGVNPGFAQRRVPPLRTRELPSLRGETINPRTLWRARIVAREVRAWLAEAPANVFHGHSRAGLAVALWLARSSERRVVASVHCYGRQRWFYRWAARQLDGRLYWLSPAMKRYYGVGDSSWTQCVPGCVPAAEATAGPRVLASDGVVRLGGVGLLVPWKRWHLVLEALARLPGATRSKLRFEHIGGANDSALTQQYAAELRTRTIALGLDDCVVWRGEQPSSAPFLREIDCLVVASRREPFSVAMLEALQAGVPVLAADSGGAQDILTPPRNGWLFCSGDAGDLARSLTMLAESEALRGVQIELADLARFVAPAVAEQWERIYARVSAGD